jgi:membrane protein
MNAPTTQSSGKNLDAKDHTVGRVDPLKQHIWDHVSSSPLHSLWDFEGTSPKTIALRTFKSFTEDNLLSRAAELGYYFLFALFPTLVSASSILGLAARQATTIYVALLNYLALVIPQSAFKMVLETFNQTTAAASGGKITFGLAAALWSASVGFSAIQDTLNIVYKVRETRPYWKARGSAILVTVLLSIIVTLTLATLLGGDFLARYAQVHVYNHYLQVAVIFALRTIAWTVACAFLILLFAVIYYFAPDRKNNRWHWLTPGAAIGIFGWLASSVALRVYLHYFNSYSVTYGSLGAVIILLTWFYITGLMLLLGAEVNSEIAAAVIEKRLKEEGEIPEYATTDAEHPV